MSDCHWEADVAGVDHTDIVIVGAGYAGMAAAVEFQKHHTPFTLLNKHDYHYFKTLLHEAAGGRADLSNFAIAIEDVVRDPMAKFLKTNVVMINPNEHLIETSAGILSYSKLMIALGGQTAFFRIPGLKEHSLVLNTLEDSKRIRRHIESKVMSYSQTEDSTLLRFVIGGGGLTGVELMGELADFLPRLLEENDINRDRLELILVHSHDDIVPGIDQKLRDIVKDKLLERKVKLLLNERVIEAKPCAVVLSGGETIHTQTFIWAGGVSANPVLESSGFSVDQRGRAIVNEHLQSVDHPDVYIVGDCAHYKDKTGVVVPQTGQVAEQMGQHAAKNVIAALHGKHQKPFVYRHHGLAVSLGPHYGVAEVGHLRTSGFAALALKDGSKAKYLMHLGGIHALIYKRKQWIHV
ncbi:NAD(P)/FAD-dependent oxidoreductase [Alicyclobacillus suci]|uniref:NAD(P)/FAD-dependent oxidoreductase n=1 Tax=Alicyclobacillus suci TaxID=2816080 RepID=UPI001A8F9A38|nr:NAD(P)/FAD-dependent oxidoreductase [Alicyclobacillus suci]